MGSAAANTCLAMACLVLSWQAHAGAAAADAAAPSATGVTTLRCGTLIDGVSASPRRNVAVRIEDGRIASVGPFSSVNAGTVIDRSQDTCLPGLIDAHAHVLIKTDDYQVDHLRRSSAYKALRGLNVVQQMLRSGWTTVRILGDADLFYAHLDVRTAIQEGLFTGPRLTGAGHYFSITGGGGDLNFLAPEHQVAGDGLVVDGVDAVRKAVREEIKHGSDWIKVLASGAMMSAGNDPDRAHYSPEELSAIVDEATRLGVPVAAHAHSAAGIKAGVHVGVGTDYVGFPVKQGVRELALLVEAGMTPMQAIQAATRVNSELLGWQDRIGTVEAGKLADIIAVPGDPLRDLSVLEKVSFVMLGGREVLKP